MSHDWPRGIHDHGDVQALLSRKKFFAEDIANNALGSGPAMEVLKALKPPYWFAGHLHVKFAAVVDHPATVSLQLTFVKALIIDLLFQPLLS